MTPLSPLLRARKTYAVIGAVGVLAVTAGIAQATRDDGGPKPPERPLALAVVDAAAHAPKIKGVSARIHFTNNLIPPGSLPAGGKSPLAAGADGKLWLAHDGRFKVDLTSADGDAQITSDGHRMTIYDSTSNTRYAFPTPAGITGGAGAGAGVAGAAPTAGMLAKLGPLLEQVNVSEAKPGTTAGRPSYTVRVSPKDDGGLLGAGELTWDAEQGMPLRAAVYAQGKDDPVLELAVTEVAYGPVDDAQLAATPHPDAKAVDLDQAAADDGAQTSGHGRLGAAADTADVQSHLRFPLAAPAELAGLPRASVRLADDGAHSGAVLTYGKGLGAIVVFEQPKPQNAPLDGLPLPEVNIDGATGKELPTALGTVVTFERDGVSYLIAGLVPPVAAENAARELR
ncbi:hypothetical protein DSM104299_04237 [Baekduia alba]|uniref:hypothetical protein n=1 Tax=Baekduia alba TaxID=2997333 RepID=UPI0023409852|nr:hypothetical protein [Baekduia alba]WCB95489.1 hypothetical protein DSM104299_04237 [Baekduia alba]